MFSFYIDLDTLGWPVGGAVSRPKDSLCIVKKCLLLSGMQTRVKSCPHPTHRPARSLSRVDPEVPLEEPLGVARAEEVPRQSAAARRHQPQHDADLMCTHIIRVSIIRAYIGSGTKAAQEISGQKCKRFC